VSVLQMRKLLDASPEPVPIVGGVRLRHIRLPGDIPAWLYLRERAFARQRPGVRAWTESDFAAEMSSKAGWTAERTWLAIDILESDADFSGGGEVIGAVTLADRAGAAAVVPVVHWLLVDPRYRQRGIGRWLMAKLEAAAWRAGHREVRLETHAGWVAAVRFYEALGYRPVESNEPGSRGDSSRP
jgi:GNAT superfamily N-acetyltransferase